MQITSYRNVGRTGVSGTGAAPVPDLYRSDLRRNRKRFLAAGLALFLLFFGYLCFRTTKIGFLSPVDTIQNLYTMAKLALGRIFGWSVYADRWSAITSQNAYLETQTRLQGALVAIILGAVMSVSGAVFQSVFRNPIAVPTMLGVSSGINIANFILVWQYSLLAVTMTERRFEDGYLCSLALLFFVLIIGRLTSRDGKFAMTDVLLVGTVLTRILTQSLNTVQYYYLDTTDYQVLQEMNMYGTGLSNARGWIFLAMALAIGMIPLLLMRTSLNVVTFTDDESRTMGLNAGVMRIFALIFSTVLIISAQIFCGEIGMLSLLVPHVCRYIYGSNTRDLLLGSILVGGIVMMLCRFVVSLTMFNQYLSVISMGMIVNIVALPLMLFMLLTNKRGWE